MQPNLLALREVDWPILLLLEPQSVLAVTNVFIFKGHEAKARGKIGS